MMQRIWDMLYIHTDTREHTNIHYIPIYIDIAK